MKIWKIASLDGNSIWILNNGKVINCGAAGHVDYLENHPEQFGISKFQIRPEKDPLWESLYPLAFKSGAVRVSLYMNEMGIEGNAFSIRKFVTIIHSLAKKYKVTKANVSTPDQSISSVNMTIEDLYKI